MGFCNEVLVLHPAIDLQANGLQKAYLSDFVVVVSVKKEHAGLEHKTIDTLRDKVYECSSEGLVP